MVVSTRLACTRTSSAKRAADSRRHTARACDSTALLAASASPRLASAPLDSCRTAQHCSQLGGAPPASAPSRSSCASAASAGAGEMPSPCVRTASIRIRQSMAVARARSWCALCGLRASTGDAQPRIAARTLACGAIGSPLMTCSLAAASTRCSRSAPRGLTYRSRCGCSAASVAIARQSASTHSSSARERGAVARAASASAARYARGATPPREPRSSRAPSAPASVASAAVPSRPAPAGELACAAHCAATTSFVRTTRSPSAARARTHSSSSFSSTTKAPPLGSAAARREASMSRS
mmetsp:Transcript_7629/g.30995  ORF Transcript_7629/g.30995 Transcript_7629/m.30995 type:complete len:297 (-) Transcript_7629:98-988(-)